MFYSRTLKKINQFNDNLKDNEVMLFKMLRKENDELKDYLIKENRAFKELQELKSKYENATDRYLKSKNKFNNNLHLLRKQLKELQLTHDKLDSQRLNTKKVLSDLEKMRHYNEQ